MLADLLEYVAGPAQLDRATSVIRGTTLIRALSTNGAHGKRRYSERALKQIAGMAEGLPAYANHVPKEQAFKPRDVRDLIGRHRNVRFDAARQAVVSDLHVAEHQAPWVFSLAQQLGDVVGNSLVSRGTVRMEGDTEVVEEIVQLRSADLVSDPATTKGLFEARSSTERDVMGQDDVHARLYAAVMGLPYIPPGERQKIALVTEAIRRGQPIDDALVEGRGRLPEDVHARLAAAVRGEASVELPADVHQQLAEAVTGAPALPEGIHARIARAVTR